MLQVGIRFPKLRTKIPQVKRDIVTGSAVNYMAIIENWLDVYFGIIFSWSI